SEEGQWLVTDRGAMRVVLNLGNQAAQFDDAAGYRVQLASREGVSLAGARLSVPADAIAILSSEPG
ncbi:MAG TPA: DUF3459 domain-containing protein, partial [Acidobacteriaceae bacterium]|nr:DUF3459 domain-containing protein [Acidobacteriaceae bacterium]